jgi:hypothetical protein
MDFSSLMGAAPPQQNFQAASGFQQTLAPSPAPQQTPPSTPQELEQRKAGWQQFIEGIQKDPSMRTAAFMMAGQLMRGPDMGESMAGGVGRAIQLGTMAHGFMQSNKARALMEQQKMEETRRLNEAQIAQAHAGIGHTQAQTHGLYQTQEQNRETHPLEVRGKELKNQSDQFTVDSQPIRLLQENETANMDRVVKQAQAENFRNREYSPGASTRMTHEREDRLIRQANPMREGESPEAYERRIAKATLASDKRSTKGAEVQALQKWIEHADDNDPMRPAVLDRLRTLGFDSVEQEETGPAPTNEQGVPVHQPSKLDYEILNLKAKAAGKKTFQGPDGAIYKVR